MSLPVIELDKLTACGLFRVRVTIEQVSTPCDIRSTVEGILGACEILSSLATKTAEAVGKALTERRGS